MISSPKYNRTLHLPWSPGATSDDKIASNVDDLIDQSIIITEKIDGSNTSLETDACYARTHASLPTHPSFDGLKALHANVKYKLPKDLQLFGEWCYAKHSIQYSELPGYWLMFGARNLSENTWLAWEEVELWAQEINVPTVPLLYNGRVSSSFELQCLTESFMKQPSVCGGMREGVVVRCSLPFIDSEFSSKVMKFVRANHVSPDSSHWKNQEIIRNKLLI